MPAFAKCKTPTALRRTCCSMQRCGCEASQLAQDLDLQALCSVSTFREIPVPGREWKSLCVQVPNGSDVQTTNWVAWPHQNCCKSEDAQNYYCGHQRALTPKLECQKGKINRSSNSSSRSGRGAEIPFEVLIWPREPGWEVCRKVSKLYQESASSTLNHKIVLHVQQSQWSEK